MPKSIHKSLPLFFKNAIKERIRIVSSRADHPLRLSEADQPVISSETDQPVISSETDQPIISSKLVRRSLLSAKALATADGEVGKWSREIPTTTKFAAFLDLDGTLIREPRKSGDIRPMEFTQNLWKFLEEEKITPYILSSNKESHTLQFLKHFPMDSQNIHSELKEKVLLFKDILSSKNLFPILSVGNRWKWDGEFLKETCRQGGISLLVNEGGISNYTHPSLFYFNVK